jgi:hypothetical protein
MTDPLRELLREALEERPPREFNDWWADWVNRVGEALAQQPEPVAHLCQHRYPDDHYGLRVCDDDDSGAFPVWGLPQDDSKSVIYWRARAQKAELALRAAPPSAAALIAENTELRLCCDLLEKRKIDLSAAYELEHERAEAAERALAGAKAQALREAAEKFDGENFQAAAALRLWASEHERGS